MPGVGGTKVIEIIKHCDNVDTLGVLSRLVRSDVARYQVDLGRAFMGGISCSHAAGVISQLQLWNPAASGRQLYVESLSMMVNDGTRRTLSVLHHNAALANAAIVAANKHIGQAAGVGVVNYENNAAVIGTAFASFDFTVTGSLLDLSFASLIRIPEGYGLNLSLGVNDVGLSGLFNWFEV